LGLLWHRDLVFCCLSARASPAQGRTPEEHPVPTGRRPTHGTAIKSEHGGPSNRARLRLLRSSFLFTPMRSYPPIQRPLKSFSAFSGSSRQGPARNASLCCAGMQRSAIRADDANQSIAPGSPVRASIQRVVAVSTRHRAMPRCSARRRRASVPTALFVTLLYGSWTLDPPSHSTTDRVTTIMQRYARATTTVGGVDLALRHLAATPLPGTSSGDASGGASDRRALLSDQPPRAA